MSLFTGFSLQRTSGIGWAMICSLWVSRRLEVLLFALRVVCHGSQFEAEVLHITWTDTEGAVECICIWNEICIWSLYPTPQLYNIYTYIHTDKI